MSTSYSAHTIIGVRLSRSAIETPEHVTSCPHDIEHGEKFCSECGTRVEIEPEKRKFDFDDDAPKGLEFLSVGAEDLEAIYVGGIITTAATWWEKKDAPMVPISMPEFDRAKERVKAFLEPLGLWDESKFGMWTVCDAW